MLGAGPETSFWYERPISGEMSSDAIGVGDRTGGCRDDERDDERDDKRDDKRDDERDDER